MSSLAAFADNIFIQHITYGYLMHAMDVWDEMRVWHVQQLASHGLFNVMIQAEGDTWIDDHHTNEDIGEQAVFV